MKLDSMVKKVKLLFVLYSLFAGLTVHGSEAVDSLFDVYIRGFQKIDSCMYTFKNEAQQNFLMSLYVISDNQAAYRSDSESDLINFGLYMKDRNYDIDFNSDSLSKDEIRCLPKLSPNFLKSFTDSIRNWYERNKDVLDLNMINIGVKAYQINMWNPQIYSFGYEKFQSLPTHIKKRIDRRRMFYSAPESACDSTLSDNTLFNKSITNIYNLFLDNSSEGGVPHSYRLGGYNFIFRVVVNALNGNYNIKEDNQVIDFEELELLDDWCWINKNKISADILESTYKIFSFLSCFAADTEDFQYFLECNMPEIKSIEDRLSTINIISLEELRTFQSRLQ